MKKCFVFAVAAFMLVAFSGVAAAGVKVGGTISFDTYYQKFNAEYMGRTALAPLIDDFSEIAMENNSSTNINVRWTSDDNKFGAYLEIAVGASNDFPSGIQYQNAASLLPTGVGQNNILGSFNAADTVYARYTYGWWQVTDGFKLTVGQDTTPFAPMNAMGQMQGTAAGQFKVVGLGFGNTHSGRVYQVRGDFKLGKLGNLGISLVDPHGSSLLNGTHWGKNGTLNAFGNQVCPVGTEESTMPRIDIGATLNLGPVTLYPSILYKKMEWERTPATPANAELDIKTMLYSLGLKANFGPVSLTGEITAGDNAGNANLLVNGIWFGYGPAGGGASFDTAAIIDGANKVADTEYLAYFLDLGFKFGHMTLHGVYGRCKIENDFGTTAALVNNPDRENTRSIWAINLWVPLSKNMIIIPEMVFYDYGDREIQNAVAQDLGKANIFGIQWLIMF